MNAQHSSASNEHYTPAEIVERARRVLGEIDLDPATCAKANETVKAARIFDASSNGFTVNWSGRVFLNPPGGKCDHNGVTLRKHTDPDVKGWFGPDGKKAKPISSQKAWWFKLAREWYAGNVEAAIFVCFSIELLQSTQAGEDEVSEAFRDPIPLDFPICFPRKRVDYMKEKDGILVPGGSPSHASAIIFLPPVSSRITADESTAALSRFGKEFGEIGRCICGPILADSGLDVAKMLKGAAA